MRFTYLFTLGAAPAMAAVLSYRAVSCTTTADAGATCLSFASSWGISVESLQQLNPGISCPNPDTSKSYCVIGTVKDDPSSATTTTTNEAVTTTHSVSDPSPTMPGIASNCNGFYKVASGDQCDTIAAKYGISEAQFRSWNTQVNESASSTYFPFVQSFCDLWYKILTSVECTNLWLDYYVCIQVPGATTTPAPKPTTEPSGPTPPMPGIIANCKSYHLVQAGDSCYSIETAAKITLAQFRAWNTLIDAACSNLWLEYYVCVGV
ncbi:uncharacterized protein N7503_009074 [Penicillium pulvis]|uniref:uncharacterized protein n=1 Tax=Penicillium pulvis TaxID=1562058 RepID=UPI00254769AF|nr:uncharacterized protein N7503_009074 [Penicillium pulvis]KAJ5793096.1 hypothetical protein N7503_009074 [Penicillium pulvis]